MASEERSAAGSLPEGADELSAMLEAAVAIARRAGELLRQAYGTAHRESFKGHAHNLVTETDYAAEALVVAALEECFPTHAVRAEEGRVAGQEGAGKVVWYVDPLDGTNNFAHGYPFFSVSLAAVQGDEILVGVTYDPLRDELFAARRGGGATVNGRRLAVSRRARLEESLVATGFPYDKSTNPDNNVAQFAAVVPHVRGIRRSGSATLDLAYVAAGRLDAYWEGGTAMWDVAAGVLLVRQAGGRVTDYDGGPAAVDGGRFVASNGRIHQELLERLKWATRRQRS